jgi:hypothetical protein
MIDTLYQDVLARWQTRWGPDSAVWIGCPSPDTWAGLSLTLSGQVDVALKEIRIENRSNAEHSGLTFSLATFVIGQLVLTRRVFRPFWATKAVRSARGPSRGSSQSGAQHLD